MIICHEYKFIFLKTRKTAGTSTEIALSHYCTPKDVLAPLVPKDEKLRRTLTGVSKRNYIPPVQNYHLHGWLKLLRNRCRIQYYNHTTAEDVFSTVRKSVWDAYFKFCFERNPWDKAVSWYYWKTAHMCEPPDLETFLEAEATDKLSNYKIYTLAGKVAVDYVARYENLNAELQHIAKCLNLPEGLCLPKTKHGMRPNRAGYSEILTRKSKSLIDHVCQREIELLGYRF